jgi:hypothetical protein
MARSSMFVANRFRSTSLPSRASGVSFSNCCSTRSSAAKAMRRRRETLMPSSSSFSCGMSLLYFPRLSASRPLAVPASPSPRFNPLHSVGHPDRPGRDDGGVSFSPPLLPAIEDGFRCFRSDDIEQNDRTQRHEKDGRQRHEAKERGQRRVGQQERKPDHHPVSVPQANDLEPARAVLSAFRLHRRLPAT